MLRRSCIHLITLKTLRCVAVAKMRDRVGLVPGTCCHWHLFSVYWMDSKFGRAYVGFLLPLGHWHCNGFLMLTFIKFIIGFLAIHCRPLEFLFLLATMAKAIFYNILSVASFSGAIYHLFAFSRMLQKYYSIQESSVSSLVWSVGTSGLWSCRPERHTSFLFSHSPGVWSYLRLVHN